MAQRKGRSSTHKFVILNIKEGQHFGYLKKKLVRIVVLFENQLLTSNQVYITPAPFFDCHFSWLVENTLLNRLQSTRADILIEFKISEEGKTKERSMGCVTIGLRQAEYITIYCYSPRYRSLELKGPKLPFGVRNPQIFISLFIQKFKPLNTAGEWHFAELDAQHKVSETSASICDSPPKQEDCSTKSQINIKKDCDKNIHKEREKSLVQERGSVDKVICTAASSDDTIATSRVFSDEYSQASEILHESVAKAAYSKQTAVSGSIISTHQMTTSRNLEVNTGSPQKPIPKEPSTSSSIAEELSITPQKSKKLSTSSSIPEELTITGTNTKSLDPPQKPKELSTCSSIPYASSYAGTCGASSTQSQKSILKDSSHTISTHSGSSDKYSGLPLEFVPIDVCSKGTPTSINVAVISSRDSQAAKIPYQSTSRGAFSKQTSTHKGTSQRDSHQSTSKAAHNRRTVASSSETNRMISNKQLQDSNVLHESTSKGTCGKDTGTSSDDTAPLHEMISDMFLEEASQIQHEFSLKPAFSKHSSTHRMSSDENSQAAMVPLKSTSKGAASAHAPLHHMSFEKKSEESATLLESTSKSTLSKCVPSYQTVSDKDTQVSRVSHESISKAGVARESASKGAYSKRTGTSSDDTAPLHEMISDMFLEEASQIQHEFSLKPAFSKHSSTHRMSSDENSQAAMVPLKSTSKGAASAHVPLHHMSFEKKSEESATLLESTSKSTLSKCVPSYQTVSDKDIQVSRVSHESISKAGVARESASKGAYSKRTGISSDDTISSHRTIPSRGSQASVLTHEFISKSTHSSRTGTSCDDTSALRRMLPELYSQATETPHISISKTASSSDESTPPTTKSRPVRSTPFDGTISQKICDKNTDVAGISHIDSPVTLRSNKETPKKTYLDPSMWTEEPFPKALTGHTIMTSDVLTLNISKSKDSSQSLPNISDDNIYLPSTSTEKPLLEESMLQEYSINETSVYGLQEDEDISKVNHIYKIELHVKSVKWLRAIRTVNVEIKFYNPHSNSKVTVKDLDYCIPNLLTNEIICSMYYMSLPEDLLKVIVYQPPQILFCRLDKKLIARGALTKKNLQDRTRLNTFDTFIPIKEKTGEIIGEAHVVIKLGDLGITSKYIQSPCLESAIKYEKASLRDIIGDFELLAAIHEKLRESFQKMDASFQKLLKVQMLESEQKPKKAVHSQPTSDSKPHVQDSKESKSSEARSFKQAGVQTTKLLKPREMAYIPKPAMTVVKYPCQGCEQYLEVGYGQRVWQDNDLTFWCKDCCIRKLQSEVKETMQKCASEVSALKNQIKSLEDEYYDFVVHSVSKEKYEYLSAAQHNLTLLFMHAKEQNEHLHAQFSLAAQKLEELKQTLPEQSPLFDITHIEHQFRKDKEQMMEACNRVQSIKREIDDFQNTDKTPKQAKQLAEGKIPTSAKPTEKNEPKLSSRKERCEACRVISNQAQLAEAKKSKPIHQSRIPQKIKPVNAGNLLKTEESKKETPATTSTFCAHEISNRMTSVRAKLQHYMEERDELVRVNRYTCDNIVVSYMTTAINKLLVEWTDLKTELEKCSK